MYPLCYEAFNITPASNVIRIRMQSLKTVAEMKNDEIQPSSQNLHIESWESWEWDKYNVKKSYQCFLPI